MNEQQQYDNTNKGVLFKNNKKIRDNQPGYTGSLNIEGKEYWLSAWVKESQAGRKFFNLSVTPKDEVKKAEPKPLTKEEEENIIPF